MTLIGEPVYTSKPHSSKTKCYSEVKAEKVGEQSLDRGQLQSSPCLNSIDQFYRTAIAFLFRQLLYTSESTTQKRQDVILNSKLRNCGCVSFFHSIAQFYRKDLTSNQTKHEHDLHYRLNHAEACHSYNNFSTAVLAHTLP